MTINTHCQDPLCPRNSAGCVKCHPVTAQLPTQWPDVAELPMSQFVNRADRDIAAAKKLLERNGYTIIAPEKKS